MCIQVNVRRRKVGNENQEGSILRRHWLKEQSRPCVSNFQVKDRHQWLGREFRGSLSLIMDKLFLKAIIHELYH